VVGAARIRFAFVVGAFAAASVTPCTVRAQSAPLPAVPGYVSKKLRDSLEAVRTILEARLVAYRANKARYDAKCDVIRADDHVTIKACKDDLTAVSPMMNALAEDKADFIAFIAKLQLACGSSDANTAVVNACVQQDGAYLIAQVPELANSPAADRIMKGYQAVMNRDWPVALAWWKDALQRDPANASLRRSVELAQWMVDRKNRVEPDMKDAPSEPIPPLSAAIYAAARGDNVSAIRHFEEAKKQNPSSAAGLDDMIDLLQRKEDARNVWSKAEIQLYDARINGEADSYTHKALKAQAAGDYEGARTYYFIAEFTRMQLSTDSPPPGAPRLQRK
jgi:tetratricopeptide (TPR) repeat protein